MEEKKIMKIGLRSHRSIAETVFIAVLLAVVIFLLTFFGIRNNFWIISIIVDLILLAVIVLSIVETVLNNNAYPYAIEYREDGKVLLNRINGKVVEIDKDYVVKIKARHKVFWIFTGNGETPIDDKNGTVVIISRIDGKKVKKCIREVANCHKVVDELINVTSSNKNDLSI